MTDNLVFKKILLDCLRINFMMQKTHPAPDCAIVKRCVHLNNELRARSQRELCGGTAHISFPLADRTGQKLNNKFSKCWPEVHPPGNQRNPKPANQMGFYYYYFVQ